VPANWGDATCVGDVLFGDWQCRLDLSNPASNISFSGWSQPLRWGYNLYSFGCNMPAPSPSSPQVSLAVRMG
jgi:hypothetical protein